MGQESTFLVIESSQHRLILVEKHEFKRGERERQDSKVQRTFLEENKNFSKLEKFYFVVNPGGKRGKGKIYFQHRAPEGGIG